MPTFPLRPRKSIAPMPVPHIASVRGLKIDAPGAHAFPGDEPVSIPKMNTFFESTLDMGGGMFMQFDPGEFSEPSILTLPIGTPPQKPPASFMDPIPLPSLMGFAHVHHMDQTLEGPPDLPRAYIPVFEKDGWKASGLDPLHALEPLLEPKITDAETRKLLLSIPLREDQEEALEALLRNDQLLFADDRGSGKCDVVAIALRALVQEGMADRILILCSEGGLRSWVETLQEWAGSLPVTVVRGDDEQRALDWCSPVPVLLAHYQTFHHDYPSVIQAEGLRFDTLVLDNLLVETRRGGVQPDVINQVRSARRWGLSGALPQRREDWLYVFSMLQPGGVKGDAQITLPDLKQQFLKMTLRRRREEFKGLPSRSRKVIWLDMDGAQTQVYQEALAEERHRIRKLGGTLTRTHVDSAVKRLKQAASFVGDEIDSVKVRALVDLVEDITSAGQKVVIFSCYPEDSFQRLQTVLDVYGMLRLDAEISGDETAQILTRFRTDEQIHVLLAATKARSDGQMMPEAGYIIHYDYDWNPAGRLRAEQRLFPSLHRDIPLQIYELAVVRTVDERLFRLLARKRMLPGQIASDTTPADLEEKITLEEWLRDVFDISSSLREVQQAVAHTPGSGPLPSTGYLRSWFDKKSPEEFMEDIGDILEGLGLPAWKPIGEPDEKGGDILASRAEVGETECILVRCIRTKKKVGIAAARKVMKDVESRPGCAGAQLITTSEFTSACKKFAAEADEKLGLMTGSELFRHLRLLGKKL